MRILIIRHGDPDYKNDTLTEKGHREAELLAERLKTEKIDYIYSSPFGRAQATCEYVAKAKEVEDKIVVKTWLREFTHVDSVVFPNGEKKSFIWDMLPSFWTVQEEMYDKNSWFRLSCFQEGNVYQEYQNVTRELDSLLAEHGYVREGNTYKVQRANRDTLAFFCHFGVECILLSHLFNISPIPLLHHFVAAPTSVTTLYTEEVAKGNAVFRCCSFGDTTHLYVGNEQPSFSARHVETYETILDKRDKKMKKEDFSELRTKIKNYFDGDAAFSKIFENCFFNTLDTTCQFEDDESVFVITGDIPAMWLRDSAAQVMQYLYFTDDENVRKLIKGVIKKQTDFIIRDTYANAFMRDASQISEWDGKYLTDRWGKLIWERKFELDSLCYPMFLACKYYEKTQDKSIFTREFLWAFEQIKRTIEIERQHSKRSTYFCRFWCKSEVVGKDQDPESEKGLVWSGYRPSDDKCQYHYHIPDNMFLVSVLYKLARIFKEIEQTEYAEYCEKLVYELKPLIEEYGTANVSGVGKIYVSETDCLGNWHADDDANIPSLLSIPYLEYPFIDEEIYSNTRKYILSNKNKYYYEGKVLKGIGSPHTPKNRVWPLSLAMQGITATDEKEIVECFHALINSTNGEGLMHEGVDADDVSKYSRPWFAWANSLFAYFVLKKADVIKRNV